MEIIRHAKKEKGIKFANLNKNNTLAEYKDIVYNKNNYKVCEVIVEQEVHLTQKEFDVISNELLRDNPIWKGIGGNEDSKRITTKVVNKDTKEAFYVDTQGYGYARYVGI
ncbi:MAG: hypothetical protein AAF443_08955, partial [Chlamydiota bacterium]